MTDLLTQAFTFKNGLRMRNRVVMASMTIWSANDDETISDEEVNYYRARATGVGLVITGCTHVQRNGVGFTNEFAAYDDRFIPSLRKLADAAKSGGRWQFCNCFMPVIKRFPNSSLVGRSSAPAPWSLRLALLIVADKPAGLWGMTKFLV